MHQPCNGFNLCHTNLNNGTKGISEKQKNKKAYENETQINVSVFFLDEKCE